MEFYLHPKSFWEKLSDLLDDFSPEWFEEIRQEFLRHPQYEKAVQLIEIPQKSEGPEGNPVTEWIAYDLLGYCWNNAIAASGRTYCGQDRFEEILALMHEVLAAPLPAREALVFVVAACSAVEIGLFEMGKEYTASTKEKKNINGETDEENNAGAMEMEDANSEMYQANIARKLKVKIYSEEEREQIAEEYRRVLSHFCTYGVRFLKAPFKHYRDVAGVTDRSPKFNFNLTLRQLARFWSILKKGEGIENTKEELGDLVQMHCTFRNKKTGERKPPNYIGNRINDFWNHNDTPRNPFKVLDEIWERGKRKS